MATPLGCYTRVQIENGKNCCHLKIHDSATKQADHKEYGTWNFKDFKLSMMKNIQWKYGGEEDAKNWCCENCNSIK